MCLSPRCISSSRSLPLASLSRRVVRYLTWLMASKHKCACCQVFLRESSLTAPRYFCCAPVAKQVMDWSDWVWECLHINVNTRKDADWVGSLRTSCVCGHPCLGSVLSITGVPQIHRWYLLLVSSFYQDKEESTMHRGLFCFVYQYRCWIVSDILWN